MHADPSSTNSQRERETGVGRRLISRLHGNYFFLLLHGTIFFKDVFGTSRDNNCLTSQRQTEFYIQNPVLLWRQKAQCRLCLVETIQELMWSYKKRLNFTKLLYI
jgi:hypothetical protein